MTNLRTKKPETLIYFLFMIITIKHRLMQRITCTKSFLTNTPVGRGRICLAGDEPGGPVIGVAVALVVARHDVDDDGVGRGRIDVPGKAATNGRKHSSEKEKNLIVMKVYFAFLQFSKSQKSFQKL